jgi:hypothetical protein
MLHKINNLLFSISLLLLGTSIGIAQKKPADLINRYVASFNKADDDTATCFISNAAAAEWMKANIPWFECADPEVERTYYFRWWVFRKHIKQTPEGFIITEFLPNVPWAGKYNSISCSAAHHIYEGRWLKNRNILNDYAKFWLQKSGQPRSYSFWIANALYNQYLVQLDKSFITALLPDLVKNYEGWEKTNYDSSGLFWQKDDRDGMEISIGGSGYRATINSYMYGDALSIAQIADMAKKAEIAGTYRHKAAALKKLVQTKLWDVQAGFFKVLPVAKNAKLADVRELHGYVPWYFNLPDPSYTIAWKYLMDSAYFLAAYGPATAERNHPRFMFKNKHECLWNGPSWPFATTQTLVALANLLNGPKQMVIKKEDYFRLFNIYTHSHQRKLPDGSVVPWIDENLDPFTGEWLARKIMEPVDRSDKNRGKDYNHSGYADLLISGLIGLRPRADNIIEVNPLIPAGKWEYFMLKDIPYHNHLLSVYFDQNGTRYGKGKGFFLFADDKLIMKNNSLTTMEAELE